MKLLSHRQSLFALPLAGLLATVGFSTKGQNNWSAPKNDARPVERYADAHVHLLDFLQNGESLNTDGKFPGGPLGGPLRQAGRNRTICFASLRRTRPTH